MRRVPELLDHEVALNLAETFKALSDPNRIKIICVLSNREVCVRELGATVGMSDSAVCHQLRGLRTMRLVRFRKQGRKTYYFLDDEHIEELLSVGLEHVAQG